MTDVKKTEFAEAYIPQFRSFIDLSDYYYLRSVFENNWIAEGPNAQEFSRQLLRLIGAKYGCLASNGTMALYLALKALGLKPGDEVIVPDTTFIASANAVEMIGARPVFVDSISYNDPSLDLARVKISKKTRALMCCHLFGTACTNIKDIADFCAKHKIFLIEDSAQALGITNGKQHCGVFGDAAGFSFYADKNITTGEGGLVITKQKRIYNRLLYLRNQGRKKSGTFIHPHIGYNFRITDIQARLGLAQLRKFNKIVQAKQRIYERYKQYLQGKVEFLLINEAFTYIPFRVVIFVKNAKRTMNILKENNIEPRSVFYPLHCQPCYRDFNYKGKDFKNASEFYRRGICLPTWVGLTEKQIEYICEVIITAENIFSAREEVF